MCNVCKSYAGRILFFFSGYPGQPIQKKRGTSPIFVAMVTSKQISGVTFFFRRCSEKKREKDKMVDVGSNNLPKIHHDRPALALILILALFCAYRRFPPARCSVTEPTMHPPFCF